MDDAQLARLATAAQKVENGGGKITPLSYMINLQECLRYTNQSTKVSTLGKLVSRIQESSNWNVRKLLGINNESRIGGRDITTKSLGEMEPTASNVPELVDNSKLGKAKASPFTDAIQQERPPDRFCLAEAQALRGQGGRSRVRLPIPTNDEPPQLLQRAYV